MLEEGTPICYSCLGSVYPDLVKLKVRIEHFVLAELQSRVPDLESWFVTWDCPIPGGCSLKRPDMLWELPRSYFQVEVDENGDDHEDDRDRLLELQASMGGADALVLRINAEGMLAKRQHSDGEIKYTKTSNGIFDARMAEVLAFVTARVLPLLSCGPERPDEAKEGGLIVERIGFA